MAKPIACPNCQYINAGSAAFCGNCGHSLVMPAASSPPAARCPHCGAANPAEAVFCGVCGRRVQVAPRTNRRSTIILLVLLIGGLATAAVTGVYYLSTRAGAAASATNGGEGNEGNPVGVEPDAPTDETIPVTPEDSETPSPTVTASLTYTPVATVTPFPTNTSRPTFTPLPTRTPTPPTPLPTPSRTATVTPMAATSAPPVACREDPGPRWGPTIWDRYKEILGCAVTGEIRGNAAYQPYQRGMMVWREDAEQVYVLYNNGSYASYPAEGPKGFYVSDLVKGSFGYLWTNNAGVRDRVGQATAAEFNATDFAAQDFAGGTIFYFFENDARNYALFRDSGTWVSAQE